MAIRRMTYYDRNNSGTVLRIVCAIVFCVLSFLYLYVYQVDVMALRLDRLFGGTKYYSPAVFSFIVTALLYVVHLVFVSFSWPYKSFYALTYFPSLLILWILTEMHINDAGCWTALSCMIFVVLVSVMLLRGHDTFIPFGHRIRMILQRKIWANILVMSVMFILACGFSSYDEIVRYRLRTERLVALGKYKEASEVGKKFLNTDSSLTMLRVYALSRQDLLGEKLFRYPLSGRSRALLPDGKDIRCLLLSNTDIFEYLGLKTVSGSKPMDALRSLAPEMLVHKPVRDYILCGCLLDKDLEGFVRMLIKCGIKDFSSLPRHYREALILYCHTRSAHLVTYHNATMDADYADMQALEQKHALSQTKRHAFVRDTYGNTYWYYYFYAD